MKRLPSFTHKHVNYHDDVRNRAGSIKRCVFTKSPSVVEIKAVQTASGFMWMFECVSAAGRGLASPLLVTSPRFILCTSPTENK